MLRYSKDEMPGPATEEERAAEVERLLDMAARLQVRSDSYAGRETHRDGRAKRTHDLLYEVSAQRATEVRETKEAVATLYRRLALDSTKAILEAERHEGLARVLTDMISNADCYEHEYAPGPRQKGAPKSDVAAVEPALARLGLPRAERRRLLSADALRLRFRDRIPHCEMHLHGCRPNDHVTEQAESAPRLPPPAPAPRLLRTPDDEAVTDTD
jgi:hypothetical protein